MKSKIVDSALSYPCLLTEINKNFANCAGVVVLSDNENYPIGQHATNWNMDVFTYFDKSITLSN